MARPDKAAAVAELTDKFGSSAGAVLTEYRGLTVKALKDLRRSLGDDATYAVSKNTLTTIAAREAGVPGIEEHLVGPTAIAFIDGDPVAVAKGLRDFARTNPLLVIKGGVLDGRSMTSEEFRTLADLESREVLLAKVAGGMQGVLQQAVSLVAAPLAQAARLLLALQQAAEENPSLIAGAGTPAPTETSPVETSPVETSPVETSPVETSPVETSPVETSPVETSTVETSPVEVQTDPEPSNDELAAVATDEPSNEELVAEATDEPAASAATPTADADTEATAASAADNN